MYLKKLKIGNVELENNIILAPMAGITDLPFRSICKKFGTGLTYTEMVSSKALYYNDEKTKKLLKVCKQDGPNAIQIFGSDIQAMEYAAGYVSNMADIIDINMGCPAPKVVKNGDGSKLLLNLELVKEIVNAVVKNSKVPVTVKIRKGWDLENVVAVEAAKIIEEAGASAITIHGRTREEFYTGIAGIFLFHMAENIGMVMGLLPITGVPLLFVSYGGSSMITSYILIGILLNISSKRQKTIFVK